MVAACLTWLASTGMCAACVAQSVPYVGAALVAIRAVPKMGRRRSAVNGDQRASGANSGRAGKEASEVVQTSGQG